MKISKFDIFLYILVWLVITQGFNSKIENDFEKETCYVKWRDEENLKKYNKGIGLSRSQRSSESLMISMSDNRMFFITDIQKDTVLVDSWMGGIYSE